MMHDHDAYRLNYPQFSLPGRPVYPVFHVSQLRPYLQPSGSTQPSGPGQSVEAIMAERNQRVGRGHQLQYLVKWTGVPVIDPQWVPARDIQGIHNGPRAIARWQLITAPSDSS